MIRRTNVVRPSVASRLTAPGWSESACLLGPKMAEMVRAKESKIIGLTQTNKTRKNCLNGLGGHRQIRRARNLADAFPCVRSFGRNLANTVFNIERQKTMILLLIKFGGSTNK